MPFKYQQIPPAEPNDPLTSRDVRFGVNLGTGSVDTGKLGDIPNELQYNAARDVGQFAGSPDPVSFVTSLPFRGVGAIGATIGQGISGVSEFLNGIGPAKAYGETVGQPIGEVGKTLLDWIGGPGRFVQDMAARVRIATNSDIPADIRALIDSGTDEQKVLDYMRETNRSFSNDAMLNLGASIILDPLNFTPFVAGKVALIPTLSKVAGLGAGAAAGSLAGGVGAIGGAVAGYKAGARLAASAPKLNVGLDLSRKIRLTQAAKADGRDLSVLGLSKYSLLADIHKGLFGKINNLSEGVKAAFAVKVAEVGDKVYGPKSWELVNKPVARIFGEKASGIVARRAALGFQQSGLSVVRDKIVGGVDEVAKAKTDLLIADANEARRQIIEEGGAGTSSEVASRLAGRPGPSTTSRYGVDESGLEEEVSAYFNAKGSEYSGGVRYAQPERALDVWKSTRNYRLANSATEVIAAGKDWQQVGVDFAKSHSDALTRGMVELHQGTVTRDAALVGAGNTALVGELAVQPIRNLANDIARAGSETLSNARMTPGATPAQLSDLVSEWFDGASIVERNGRETLVGGKFFDEGGRVVKDPIVQRELAQRIAWAQHIRYGFAVNRVGNIRRIATVAAGFEAANDARKTAIRKEVSKLIGRSVTDQQIYTLGKMKNASVTRMTLLRKDNLIDVEVDKYLKLFAMVDNAELKASELVAIGVPESAATALANIGSGKPFSPAIRSQRRQLIARMAERQFADVRNNVALAKGVVDPDMVEALLTSAAKNDATFSAAKAGDVAQLKAFWQSIGGSEAEIDNLMDAVYASGYRIGIAPSDNMMRVPVKVGVKQVDGTLQDQVLQKLEPYVDLTSDFIDGMPRVDGGYTKGFFTHNLRRLFSPVLQSEITSSARQRMLTSLGAYFTPDEIVAFDNAINERAASQRIGVRGLVNGFGNRSQIYEAMDSVLKERGVIGGLEGRLKEATSVGLPKMDIDNAILKAYAGEIGTSGVTQWITGQVKANGIPGIGMNKLVAQLTENFYPTLKYAANPFFWVQEIIESPFFKEMRGIRTEEVVGSLRKVGLTPQDVRAMLGERASSVARNLHEASFGTAVALRGGAPTTILPGIEQQSVIGVIKSLRKKNAGESRVETVANYKEAQKDIMAIYEFSRRWADDLAKKRPDEYVKMVEEFGNNEMDMLAGHLARYQRAVDLAWGDPVFDHIRPQSWGFAVGPSEQSLIRARQEADAFASYLDDDESIAFMLQHKPSDLTRLLKIRVLDEARLGGYDTNALSRLIGDVEEAARKVKFESAGSSIEAIKSSKAYSDLKDAINNVRKETVDGLGNQILESGTNELILRRLFDLTGTPGEGPTFEVVLKALANGRKYGAKFNSLGSIIGEVFDRTSAGSAAFRGLSEAQKIERIDAIIKNILPGGGPITETQINRISRTLHDSAIRLIEDHATEELAFQAAKFRYQETAMAMDKINYFNPDRGFLERSMNHQFLGLYPLSYMFGKVLPETARFLFWKPFGAFAPGAGFQAYRKFIDYLSQNGLIPDFEKKGTERPDYLFFLTQLIPGTPEDITVGLPGWMRRGMSTISRQGYDQLTADQLFSEIGKPLVDTGVVGAGRMVFRSLQEITGLVGQEDDQIKQDITSLR